MNKFLGFTLTATNIILYLVMIALWLSIPEELWLCLSLTAFNISLSVMILFLERKKLAILLKSHWFRSFGQAIVSLFLIFCILGLINYLSFKTPKAWDLTAFKLNSLSYQTRNLLNSLSDGADTLEAINFKIFANREQAPAIRSLVELYRLENSALRIEVIDPEVRPDLVKLYEVTKPNTIIVEMGSRRERVETLNELHLTNALIRITRTDDPVLCFTTGHEEANLSQAGAEGYSFFRDLLIKNSYRMQEILTVALTEIPSECRVVALLAPQKTLRTTELELLNDYLNAGGSLLVAIGPDFNQDYHHELREFLKGYDVKIHNDLVIDQQSHVSGSNGTIPLVKRFDRDHPITKDFEGLVFLPLSSSLEILNQKRDSIRHTVLLETTPAPFSWAEKNIDSLISGDFKFDESLDRPGPIPLMVALEDSKSRLVLMGNGTLLMNSYSNYGANFLLMQNALSWLAKEERLIAFETAAVKDEPVFVSGAQLGIIFYFSVIFVPLMLFLMAFYVYRRRSKL